MSGKKKKSRNQDAALKTIVLITAILQLVKAAFEFISRLFE